MAHAFAYVVDHIIAIVALLTTLVHLALRSTRSRKALMFSLQSIEKLAPVVLSAIGQAGAFENGHPLTIVVPPESVQLDLTKDGLGKVTVSESGTTLTFVKSV